VVRDKTYLDPLGVELRPFMKQNAQDCLVITFVNDAYLKSDNCMYEASQAMNLIIINSFLLSLEALMRKEIFLS
jgi:hypothetical protein